MIPAPAIANLLHNERAGYAPGRVLGALARTLCARPLRRLHRQQRGVVSIFFLLMFFTFYTAGAMVWNTGQALGPKVRAQAAADVAAYNSAVIMSRAVNLTAMTNYAAVRNASAYAAAWSSVAVDIGVPVCWIIYIAQAYSECGGQITGLICAAAAALECLAELPDYIDFATTTSDCWSTAFDFTGGVCGRVSDLADFQEAICHAVPDLIDKQREITEKAFGVTIRLTQPISSGDSSADVKDPTGDDTGKIAAPLQEGNVLSAVPWFNLRFLLVDSGWPRSDTIGNIKIGKARIWWYVGGVPTIELMALIPGAKLRVLTTQTAMVGENGADTKDRRKSFSVLATAVDERDTQRQLMLNYWFNRAINSGNKTVAYAEAETFHGLDSSLTTLLGFSLPVPWRAWTPAGAQWSARLTKAEHFADAFNADATMRGYYRNTQLNTGDMNDTIDKINLH